MKFNKETGTWEVNNTVSETWSKEYISVLTYNILYKLVNEERIGEVLWIIIDSEADVVALQEVNDEIWEMILKNEVIWEKYIASNNKLFGKHGLKTLS